MKGKILGIPLVLIMLSISLAAMVDVPMYILHMANMEKIGKVEKSVNLLRTDLNKPTATPTMTPAPTETPAPTPRFKVNPTVAAPTSSPSGIIR